MPKNNAGRIAGLGQAAAEILGLSPEEAQIPVLPEGDLLESTSSAWPRLIRVSSAQITARSPLQTRPPFDPNHDPEDLELVRSVKDHGVIQPVVVYRIDHEDAPEPHYGLISGHRRLDAADYAHLSTIPALLVPVETDGRNRDLLTALENLQRKDLQPLEKAAQIRRLMERYGYSQRDVADFIGLSEAHVSSLLHLLATSPLVQAALQSGKLGIRHVREAEQLPETQLSQVLDLADQGFEFKAAIDVVTGGMQPEEAGPEDGRALDTAEVERLSREAATWEREPDPSLPASLPGKAQVTASLQKPQAPRTAGPLARFLREPHADAFWKAFNEHSLQGLIADREVLLLALVWEASGQDMAQSLSAYRALTRPVRLELEKALLALDRLSVLAVGASHYAGSRGQMARYLDQAIQSWFGK